MRTQRLARARARDRPPKLVSSHGLHVFGSEVVTAVRVRESLGCPIRESVKVRGGRAVGNRRTRRRSSAGRAAHRPTGHGSIEVGTGVGAGEGAAVGGVVGTGVGKDVGAGVGAGVGEAVG